MKASERVTAIANRMMERSGDEQNASVEYKGNEIMATACLGSSRALLAMAKILRVTAAQLRIEEETEQESSHGN